MKPLFIAEIKTRSPFGFRSKLSWDDLLSIALEYGDAVAVHTDPRWGGSMIHLARASRAVHTEHKLLIAKGIHAHDDEIRQALDFGADLVLVVGRQPPPELAPVCIWEPSTGHDFIHLKDHSARVMWNSRDLITGDAIPPSLNIRWARNYHKGWLCQASFIARPIDVSSEADAFIVGEHLPTFVEAL